MHVHVPARYMRIHANVNVIVRTFCRTLHSDDIHLLHRMVGVVERLLDSSHFQEEMRLLGGIPLLLGLLR